MGIKKSKIERKRYNSNTSSLDSEPPSPTPRISRPGLNNSPTNCKSAFAYMLVFVMQKKLSFYKGKLFINNVPACF